jgi:NADH-quinone oxidoreductase subunit E
MSAVAEPITFSTERLARAQELISHYPEGKQKSAILPLLHLAQEQWGWVSPEVQDYVASLLGILPIEVYEVATFYTMFHIEPVGTHVIEYCRTGPCVLMGGEQVYAHAKNKPSIECLAACGWGPCFQIREQYHLHLTNEKVDEIIEGLSH